MSSEQAKPAGRGRRFAVWLVILVLLAVALLAAMPAYREYVMQITRTDAQRELRGLAQQLQRCFARTGNYAVLDSLMNACVTLPQSTSDGMYLITGQVAADNFRLTATPQSTQAKDKQCGALTLDQAGGQGVTGTRKEEDCWSDPRS